MVLCMARVRAWDTYMLAKIIRAVGDVGVPPFWLDPWPVALAVGRGLSLSERHPFLGNSMT